MKPLPLHLLPRKLREMVDCCGESVTLAIWKHYGGGHLSVPEKLSSRHALVTLLGRDEATKFCRLYEGEVLNIAKADMALRAVRNALICQQREQGAGLFSLAREHGLTERQVQSILKAGADPVVSQQLDLFGEQEYE